MLDSNKSMKSPSRFLISFEDEDYVQILTAIATEYRPAFGVDTNRRTNMICLRF